MENILINHGTILTVDENDTIIEDGSLVIEQGRIVFVGPTTEIQNRFFDYQKIDANGMLVMPGLVNTHTHLGATILRGISDDVDGMEWMPLNWSVTKYLNEDDLFLSALLGISEMIASGTTCFSDAYQQIEQTAKAVKATGIRAELAAGLTEKNGKKEAQRCWMKPGHLLWNGMEKLEGVSVPDWLPTHSIPVPLNIFCKPAKWPMTWV